MIGTAEERYMKRRALIIAGQQKSATVKHFGTVRPGTRTMLIGLCKTSRMSMDELLSKLARMGGRMGV